MYSSRHSFTQPWNWKLRLIFLKEMPIILFYFRVVYDHFLFQITSLRKTHTIIPPRRCLCKWPTQCYSTTCLALHYRRPWHYERVSVISINTEEAYTYYPGPNFTLQSVRDMKLQRLEHFFSVNNSDLLNTRRNYDALAS